MARAGPMYLSFVSLTPSILAQAEIQKFKARGFNGVVSIFIRV